MTGPMPPPLGDERAVVLGFLEFHRATFQRKCAGLSAADLARRSVPPSSLSLLGLIRHVADNEQAWFDVVAGRDRPGPYESADDPDGSFDHVDGTPEQLDEAWATWHRAVDEARDAVAARSFDDVVQHRTFGPMTVRWIVVHMVEEYARHNGHADLLRETIDGATGE
jgi:uncharacterized damage-inducible protein DinB